MIPDDPKNKSQGRDMVQPFQYVAIEKRLRDCRNVITLGVKPDFSDYTANERMLILNASKVYYPSSFYAGLFNTMGKVTFPTFQTYLYAQDKIKQTALFNMMNIPHPRTHIFFGNRGRKNIMDFFKFPFIGKIPRGSALGRGVFLIQNPQDLEAYLEKTRVAYIQDYFPIKKDIRVVVIGRKVVLSYWRISKENEFRTNVALGGKIDMEHVPETACELALSTALACGWNDVGMDIIEYENRFYVIEANMKYGKAGFAEAGIDYPRLMEEMMENGDV
jgi:ribosomal protein S6--L-glutamate ligase